MQAVMALFVLALGAWTVEFQEESQLLTLTHAETQVVISGELAFTSGDATWRITEPQDGVHDRLALVDPSGNVQGYLRFTTQGDRLEALVYHRTRQFYEGVLSFKGDVLFPEDSFPCRTQAKTDERVLFLASGTPDSPIFDSLFAREQDLALRFDAPNFRITTLANAPKSARRYLENARYGIETSGRIQQASESVFVVEADCDYFKKRWVPYYAPIDRARCPKPPTGWMSWNVYFDKATAEDNLAEARIGKEKFQPFGLEFWSIESWQGNSDQLPVSKFYNLNLETNENQFPLGMKKLADDIRALGFRPGLWTAPFGTGSDEFYESHKDWFLHDKEGKPIGAWNGKYMIDPSNDEVVERLRKIHDVASHEWGYEFFKIDGMSGSGPGYCAHMYERPDVRAVFKNPDVEAPFERCVRALREGIGNDRVFLACQGHFTGPEAKYADAARTGADIVHPNQPVKWANVLQQAGRTLNQIFVNNIVFYSDPDTLLVRDLTPEEARVTATVVALPGQQTFFGDFLGKLSSEQTRMLQQTLPVVDARPGALYPYFDYLPIWDLKVGRPFGSWDVVAFFNWSDEKQTIGVELAELGLAPGEYVAYEFWTDQFCGTTSTRLSMEIPPRAVRLFTLHPLQANPQFLSSDRHLTQGAVDLVDVQWNKSSATLATTFKLVADHRTTTTFRIPADYRFVSATGNDVDVETSITANGEILKVGMTAKDSGDYPIVLLFEKKSTPN